MPPRKHHQPPKAPPRPVTKPKTTTTAPTPTLPLLGTHPDVTYRRGPAGEFIIVTPLRAKIAYLKFKWRIARWRAQQAAYRGRPDLRKYVKRARAIEVRDVVSKARAESLVKQGVAVVEVREEWRERVEAARGGSLRCEIKLERMARAGMPMVGGFPGKWVRVGEGGEVWEGEGVRAKVDWLEGSVEEWTHKMAEAEDVDVWKACARLLDGKELRLVLAKDMLERGQVVREERRQKWRDEGNLP